jgi:hypothetical protein
MYRGQTRHSHAPVHLREAEISEPGFEVRCNFTDNDLDEIPYEITASPLQPVQLR